MKSAIYPVDAELDSSVHNGTGVSEMARQGHASGLNEGGELLMRGWYLVVERPAIDGNSYCGERA